METAARGNRTNYKLSIKFRIVPRTDPLKFIPAYTYDSNGRLVAIKTGRARQSSSVAAANKHPSYRKYNVNPQPTVKEEVQVSEKFRIGNNGYIWYINNHYRTFVRFY